ncbi:MAG TPA: DUF3185 family protein [Gammaproteobacteria bacterium]|nr:DUF3185 family protein [Gammaproteobacteria bacterium]
MFGILLVILGIVLLAFGYNAADAPLEEVGEALTGRYSHETMAYLIGGTVSFVLGLVLSLKR